MPPLNLRLDFNCAVASSGASGTTRKILPIGAPAKLAYGGIGKADISSHFTRVNALAFSGSEHDDAANGFTGVHQIETVVDVGKLQLVRDQVVDVDLPVHVPVDDFRHVAPPLGAAERGALPHAAGDELERPRLDFLAGAGNTDDHR